MNVRTSVFLNFQRQFFAFFIAFLSFVHLPVHATFSITNKPIGVGIAHNAKDFALANSTGFADLIEKVGSAVVNIRILSQKRSGPSINSFFPNDDFFNEFFSHFFQNLPNQSSAENSSDRNSSTRIVGVGSGFLISPDGYIMTNAHVVNGGDEILVKMKDIPGEFKAKVIGADTLSDLAVLKIDKKELPYLRFGDSDRIRVGEWVIAIGSPFDLENSVTVGVLSAKYRHIGASVDGLSQYPFLQTDAALNRGNSGGPLLNVSGEVVGINSQILSGTGEFAGISFSVPSNLAKEIFEQLKQKGYVRRGRIGVHISDLDPEAARAYKLPLGRGVLVASVEEKGPAEKAGVKAGDIILSFNDELVKDARSIQNAVSRTKPGSLSRLEILRDDKKMLLRVNVEELSKKNGVAYEKKTTGLNINGLVVVPGDVEFCKRNHAAIGCVVIQSVDRNSPFNNVLRRGDVVLELNRHPIIDIDVFRKKIKLWHGRVLLFLISNKGAVRLVSLR